MAISDEDKAEFKKLFSDSMAEYESAKEEAAAKNQKTGEGENKEKDTEPRKLSFAERMLGIKE